MNTKAASNVIGAFDAKNKLGQLLDQVERGEVIVITRHGTPVARLVPYQEEFDQAEALRVAEEIRRFRKGNVLPKGLTIGDMIREGRR